MGLNSINTNIAAYYAQMNIGKASTSASSSIGRLSSGNRIVRASDDVAALSVGTSLRTQVTTLRQALVNTSQGSSLLQVADGALSQITDILQRQKAIAVQAGSGSLSSAERGFLNQEFQNLKDQIDQIATTTNFNNVKLLGGGLGTKTSLVQLDTSAAFFDPTSSTNATSTFSVASEIAIQGFNLTDGTILGASGAGAAAPGEVMLVTDSTGATEVADAGFNNVNGAVYGQFSNFRISNVTYAVAATITATLNGVEFSGTVADQATQAVLSNGTTFIQLGITTLDLTDDATTQISQQQLAQDFKDTGIMHTTTVTGVNFDGTRLHDVIGANGGIAMLRVMDPTNVEIRDFRYVSNNGAADTNTLTVQINGKTFTATVNDAVADGDVLVFEAGNGEALTIDLTGLSTAAANPNTDLTNIRIDLNERADFINALNIGFSRAGSGLSFAVGSQVSDSINVRIRSADSTSLYNGANLNVSTAVDAAAAANALDTAIKTVSAIRADVGALQSRFNFAAANVESSIQNQDAARGVLLDTDIAAESSAFATAQVQLQAGISVLAQANLLPQNLLKLIG